MKARSVHVVRFRVPLDVDAAVEACRRAFRNVDWQQQTADTLTIPLPSGGVWWGEEPGLLSGVMLGSAVSHVTDRLLRRVPPPSTRAPDGPPVVAAELYGAWREVVVVRVSLIDAGAFGTDVVISGSDVANIGLKGRVRDAVGELRRSIEIQSGVLTPGRP